MAVDNSDLAGDTGMVDAMSGGIRQANDVNTQEGEATQTEMDQVRELTEEYQTARDFDDDARAQYAKDRKIAAGKADERWASNANLVGSFIDILVSFLYAKNPDCGVRPAEKVVAPTPPPPPPMQQMAPTVLGGAPAIPGGGLSTAPPGLPPIPGTPPAVDPMDPMAAALPPPGMPPVPGLNPMAPPGTPGPSQQSRDTTAFAQTLALIISRLWRDAKLKKAARKQVRSSLSVGPGWFKALMFSETKTDPQVEKQMRDVRDSLEELKAQRKAIEEGDEGAGPLDVQIANSNLTLEGLGPKLERLTRQGLSIDYCRAEDVQVSLDVAEISDYLDADWNSFDLYVPKVSLRKRFPLLTAEDVKAASTFYQRKGLGLSDTTGSKEDGEGTFTKRAPGNSVGGKKPVEFCKIVELWDKRDGMIKTFVDGVKRWVVLPYTPPQVTTRFYPHFLLALYEVNDQRHPQSLSDRLAKLQNEYASTRSAQSVTRSRSIPRTAFNAGMLSPDDVKKIEQGVAQEMIGLSPTDNNLPLDKILAPIAIATVPPGTFDTQPITSDMERISGVQEALQSSVTQAKTATEAGIQQSGFASRTNTDRDTLEDVLTDFAQYTAECAIQEIKPDMAERIAGDQCFWPYGMDVQDVLSMVEVEIDAGTTGKPNAEAERQAWSTILPLITTMMTQIRQLESTDPAMAEAFRNLMRETLRRLDDRLDIDMFLAAGPPPLLPMMPPGAPGAPGATPSLPGAPPVASGAPPV